MYRFRFLLLILVVPVVVMGLRCGSDSPTGTGDDPSGTFTVELEDYTEWHDDEAGSMYLRAEACSKASGGAMVKGLDYPGEYIEVPMTVDVGGTYEATVRYAALAGDTLKAVMVVGDCVSPLTEPGVEFVMDEGAGLGWQLVYKVAAGGSTVTLEEGECVLRFTHTYGTPTGQMDAITFVPVTRTR